MSKVGIFPKLVSRSGFILALEPLPLASSKAIRGISLHVYSIYRLTSLGVWSVSSFLEHLSAGIDAYYAYYD